MTEGYFVYILANKSGQTYIGVTNSLERRIWEHKTHQNRGFASKYKMHSLVLIEAFPNIDDAIAREKQLKKWSREKKVWLIERENPGWVDLSIEMFHWVDTNGDVVDEAD